MKVTVIESVGHVTKKTIIEDDNATIEDFYSVLAMLDIHKEVVVVDTKPLDVIPKMQKLKK